MKNPSPLLPIFKKYFEKDPSLAAHTLETMSTNEAVDVVTVMPAGMMAELINHLNDAYCAALLEKLPPSIFAQIVSRLEVQKAASIFRRFRPETKQALLDVLTDKRKRQIKELLNYPDDSAGQIMSLDFIAFHRTVQVKDAVAKIRNLVKKGTALSYIYIVDEQDRIIGIMNMRDMLLAESHQNLGAVMRSDVFTVNCFDDLDKVAHQLSDRNYFAAPVVDSQNRLLGVVRAEQLIEDVQEAASEDMQKMFGAGGDERAFSPISRSLRTRLPWLHVNLATAFLAAAVVAMFEDIIARITVLAIYLPVVAGQGGNAGAQSLAIVMRGLVMREIPSHKARQLIFKETRIGIINGLVLGVVTGLIAWLWQGNPYLGVVISLGMLVNLTVAGFAGAFIPLGMKATGLDPAQCSNIILTTITDVMGFLAFLGFAVLFQDYLI